MLAATYVSLHRDDGTQVRGARHPHLGVPQLLHPPGALPRREAAQDLRRGRVQVLPPEVRINQ